MSLKQCTRLGPGFGLKLGDVVLGFETSDKSGLKVNHLCLNDCLILGARLIDMDIRMNPARLEAVNWGPSWWDYFVGIKTQNIISNKWGFDFYGTIGTGGSDLPWTLQATFARRYSNDNRLMLGFRAWGLDYSETKNLITKGLDLTVYGFTVGYEFN
jgi:hypothetical protein